MAAPRLCCVCNERPKGAFLCEVCGRDYDRALRKDTTIGGIVAWAAERARNFERRRKQPVLWTHNCDGKLAPAGKAYTADGKLVALTFPRRVVMSGSNIAQKRHAQDRSRRRK